MAESGAPMVEWKYKDFKDGQKKWGGTFLSVDIFALHKRFLYQNLYFGETSSDKLQASSLAGNGRNQWILLYLEAQKVWKNFFQSCLLPARRTKMSSNQRLCFVFWFVFTYLNERIPARSNVVSWVSDLKLNLNWSYNLRAQELNVWQSVNSKQAGVIREAVKSCTQILTPFTSTLKLVKILTSFTWETSIIARGVVLLVKRVSVPLRLQSKKTTHPLLKTERVAALYLYLKRTYFNASSLVR